MRIRMTTTTKASPDGIQVNTYEQGRTYELPEPFARIFLDNEWAIEDKALDAPPETKAKRTARRKKKK